MDFSTPAGSHASPVSERMFGVLTGLAQNLRLIVKAAAIIIVVVELGAIWNEVRQMRSEQVINRFYSLPEQRRKELKGTAASKRMESSSFVDGEVSIDGEVD